MRKVLSLLICVAMLCSLVVITAQADTPTANFANVTAVPGGSATIEMKLTGNPGLASLKFKILDNDGLGATYAGVDATGGALGLTANDEGGVWYWVGAANYYGETFGTLTITIPDEAEAGDYEFTVQALEGFDDVPVAVDLAGSSFIVSVVDKVITGVNVAIDAGLSIGVHVDAADIEGVSITAVNLDANEYKTIKDYVEDEENGGYIFYLNVNPWAMDAEFKVDFTDLFTFSSEEEDAKLDTNKIPASAKTTGILSYCDALLKTSPSDELKQLIADLLAFGQEAQTYQGVAVMDISALSLTPTEAAWEDSNSDPCDFGTYCSENFPEDQTGKNATAKKKFKFIDAKIKFGSKFVVIFDIGENVAANATAATNARMKVDGETYSLTTTSGNNGTFKYAFSPAQYAGVEFDLYAASSTTATNFAWINNYGPAHYAAYVNDSGDESSAAILALLEAFYNYGVSVEAYVGSLGE